MRTAPVLLMLFCLIAAGCAGSAPREEPGSASEVAPNDGPVGATWRLTDFGEAAEGGARPASSRSAITADFERMSAEEAGGRLSGSGGCNRYSASYQSGHDTLAISPVGATKRACPPLVMEEEKAYFAALEATRRWEQRGNQLSLMNESGRLLLRLVPETTLESDRSSVEANGQGPG